MRITVNGIAHELEVAGHETLLGVLRERLALTGTKLSCERGECGACTVLLTQDSVRRSAYACLTLAAACEDAEARAKTFSTIPKIAVMSCASTFGKTG